MDINNDGNISNGDRAILASCWLSDESENRYIPAADINGDGDISGGDRAWLSQNWLSDVGGDDGLVYPKPLYTQAVFAEYASGDPDMF